jgi:hypothetical protein
VEYIKQVCWFKTLVGLQPLTRFEAKHHRCIVVVTSYEDVIVDFKQKKPSITHKRIFKDVELATRFDKERLKRHKLGFDVKKSRKQHSQQQIKKVDGDVVTLSNSTIE